MPDLPPIARRVSLVVLLLGFFAAGLGLGIVLTGGVSGAIYGNRGSLQISGTNTGSALYAAQGGDGVAIRGDSQTGDAGRFNSTGGTAVRGISGNADANAIYGELDTTTVGSGAAVRGTGKSGTGVAGSSQSATRAGVSGASSGGGVGTLGVTSGGAGAGTVGVANGAGSAGVVARSYGDGGVGLVAAGASGAAVYASGDVTATGSVISGGLNVGTTGIVAFNAWNHPLPVGTPVRAAGVAKAVFGGTPALAVLPARAGDYVVGVVAKTMTATQAKLPGVGFDGQLNAGGAVTVFQGTAGDTPAGGVLFLATAGVIAGVSVDPGSGTVAAGTVLVMGPNLALVPRAAGDLTTPMVAIALDKAPDHRRIAVLLTH